MPSSEKILQELERSSSSAMNLALMAPAAATGLETLGNTHAVVQSYSPDRAEQIPLGADAGFWRKLTLGILPLFLAFGWVAFFKSVRNVAEAPERSWDLWLKAGINFVTAAGATLAMVFMLTGLTAFVPYLLVAVLGLSAVQGLYHAVKQCYFAYKNPKQRWQHLQEAGKQVLVVALNALALVLNVLVFQTAHLVAQGIHDFASDILSIFLHFQELMDLINGPVMSGITLIQGVGLGWLAGVTLWFAFSASKLNKQSYQLFSGTRLDEPVYELEAFQDVSRILDIINDKQEHPLKRAFFMLSAPLTLPLYVLTAVIHFVILRPVAAVLVGLPELLLRGLYYCGRRSGSSTLEELQLVAPPGSKPEELTVTDIALTAPLDQPTTPQKQRLASTLDLEARRIKKQKEVYSPKHSQFKPQQQVVTLDATPLAGNAKQPLSLSLSLSTL